MAIAEGSGQKLRKLASISDNRFSYRPWIVYDSASETMSAEASPEIIRETTAQITPSEQIVSASVTAVYKIK